MNLATLIILCCIVSAAIVALRAVVKNKETLTKCSGCSADCNNCEFSKKNVKKI